MDERDERAEPRPAPERPLTRRELRALEESRRGDAGDDAGQPHDGSAEVPAPGGSGAVGAGPETARAETASPETAHAGSSDDATTEPGTDLDPGTPVDVTAQIPRVLTEDDGDADDVRWDGPFPPVGHVPPAASRWPAPPLSELAQGVPPPPAPPPPVLAAGDRPGGDRPVTGDRRDASTPSDGPDGGTAPATARVSPGTPEAPAAGTAAQGGSRGAPSAPSPGSPEVDEPGDDAEARGEAPVTVAWDHGIGDGSGAFVPPASAEPRPAGPPTGEGAAAEGTDAGDEGLPTLDDLLAGRPAPATGPAEMGWQAALRRITGGLVSPRPGAAERRHRDAVASVQRTLDGPRTVVVINPKGGAQKTTATLLIAATFGMHRGGYTLAWDNNETRGTLGWRSHPAPHHSTAVDLLQDLGRFDEDRARVGDLDTYVRAQGSAQFDVLASDEDAASAASIDAYAFRSLHRTLARFYRVMVIDTGNNMRASNWQAALEAADQVVIVSTVREDTSQSAAWAVDAMRATGHADAVERAVTVLSSPAPRRDEALAGRLHEHFGRLTRAVLDVPYDPALVAGGPIDYEALSRESREAWLHVTAAVADGL